ncbi:immunoglobulin E-set, partial [Trametes punicea]
PHPGASDVIVTGSFDSWSCSHHLTRTPSGHFEGTIKVPWGETVQYKYIVDGRWTTTDDQPTELDPIGNLNNVLRAPARP